VFGYLDDVTMYLFGYSTTWLC